MNVRAEQRINELGLGGFPTTFFDGGYREVVGGFSDNLTYTEQIETAGARSVNTNVLELTVSMRWLGGEGSSADDIEVTVSITVLPRLSFSYPDGFPEVVGPGEETSINVNVEGAGIGVPVSGSGQLHYSINGGVWESIAMVESLPNEYEAILPALTCDESIDYYFSAEEQTEGMMYDYSLSPLHANTFSDIDTVFVDDFDTGMGWTISGGQWARGVPTGGGGAYGNPDPTSGHSGSNIMGYNLNGDYGNGIPEYHATSPAIDCSGLNDVQLRFWRWLGVESPDYDHAYIRISNNGSTWNTIWSNQATIEDDSWTEQVFDITPYASDQSTVYVRYTMGVTDASWPYCGWNIDDVAVIGYGCDDPCFSSEPEITYPGDTLLVQFDEQFVYCPEVTDPDDSVFTITYEEIPHWCYIQNDSVFGVTSDTVFFEPITAIVEDGCSADTVSFNTLVFLCGNINLDNAVNIIDITYMIDYLYNFGSAPDPLIAGDVNDDSFINIIDVSYLISYLYNSGPSPECLE